MRTIVMMAIAWLLKGLLLGAASLGARAALVRWRAVRRRVMHYPGSAAVGTYLALETLPLSVTVIVLGVGATQLGSPAVAGLLVTTGALVGLGSMIVIGLLLPNLGVERTRTPA